MTDSSPVGPVGQATQPTPISCTSHCLLGIRFECLDFQIQKFSFHGYCNFCATTATIQKPPTTKLFFERHACDFSYLLVFNGTEGTGLYSDILIGACFTQEHVPNWEASQSLARTSTFPKRFETEKRCSKRGICLNEAFQQ